MTDVATTRAHTRAAIVDAAASLLQAGGPAAVTTRGVAERAGVQAPTIYRLFGDKDGLLEAVAEHVMATFVSAKTTAVAAAATAGVDPLEDLRTSWRQQIDFGLTNPAVFRLLSDPDRVRRLPGGPGGQGGPGLAGAPAGGDRSPPGHRAAGRRPDPGGGGRHDPAPAGDARRAARPRARRGDAGGGARPHPHRRPAPRSPTLGSRRQSPCAPSPRTSTSQRLGATTADRMARSDRGRARRDQRDPRGQRGSMTVIWLAIQKEHAADE